MPSRAAWKRSAKQWRQIQAQLRTLMYAEHNAACDARAENTALRAALRRLVGAAIHLRDLPYKPGSTYPARYDAALADLNSALADPAVRAAGE